VNGSLGLLVGKSASDAEVSVSRMEKPQQQQQQQQLGGLQ